MEEPCDVLRAPLEVRQAFLRHLANLRLGDNDWPASGLAKWRDPLASAASVHGGGTPSGGHGHLARVYSSGSTPGGGGGQGAQSRVSTELAPAEATSYASRAVTSGLLLVLDVITLGATSRWLGFHQVHDRLVRPTKVATPRGAAAAAAGGSHIEFVTPLPYVGEGAAFNSRRHASIAVMALAGLVSVLLLLSLAIFFLFTFMGSASPSTWRVVVSFIQFQRASIDRIILDQYDPVAASFLAIFLCYLSAGVLIQATLHKVDGAQLLGIRAGGVAAVLPQLMKTENPLVMISYPWQPGTQQTARSLAFALPDAWLDVKWLVSGGKVPRIIAQVARSAHCLIMVMSGDYLRRGACCLEFENAVLYRDALQHVTLVYADPSVPAVVVDTLRRGGFTVYREATVHEMLRYLDEHVYRSADDEDLARIIRWYQLNGTPADHIDRRVTLPAAAAKAKQKRCNLYSRPRVPREALFVGRRYLSSDGLHRGEHWGVTDEQVLVASWFICGALAMILFTIGCKQSEDTSSACPHDLLGYGPAGCLTIAVGMLMLAVPLLGYMDGRTPHHPLLLPIHAAAYLSQQEKLPSRNSVAPGVMMSQPTKRLKVPRMQSPVRTTSSQQFEEPTGAVTFQRASSTSAGLTMVAHPTASVELGSPAGAGRGSTPAGGPQAAGFESPSIRPLLLSPLADISRTSSGGFGPDARIGAAATAPGGFGGAGCTLGFKVWVVSWGLPTPLPVDATLQARFAATKQRILNLCAFLRDSGVASQALEIPSSWSNDQVTALMSNLPHPVEARRSLLVKVATELAQTPPGGVSAAGVRVLNPLQLTAGAAGAAADVDGTPTPGEGAAAGIPMSTMGGVDPVAAQLEFAPCVVVFVLESERAVDQWLATVADTWPADQTVLVVDWDASGSPSRSPSGSTMRDFMLLVTGSKNGVSPLSPYAGFAHAVVDAIGAKVGRAFLSAAARTRAALQAAARA